ncbi:MAG: phosphoglycerate dehydrogenase [Alphaproteobacteria bacterium]|nr:phosphoglycerate dehydrogenase [Alphaproteobacteria bacterium]
MSKPPNAPKVLIADDMSPLAAETFRARGLAVDVKTGLAPEALAAALEDCDGLAVRSATKVKAATLANASRLKVIGRAGIGVDNIDVPAATARGVVVMNTPYGNSITTAEHAIALMMALARQIPEANASTHAGKWEKNAFMGVELLGKTLGIIGCGNIGAVVADRAQGLKMKVVAYDPFLTPERAADLRVEKVDLDELLTRADFISLHTPLTDATRNIIDAKALAKAKKGVRIVNCARGGLIVEADLKAALESGHVAGAALDVFAEEPATNNPLFGMARMVATPHLGASTTEAQEKVALQVAEQMADYLLTGAVSNALNMPSVTAEEAPKLKPYMKLAEQLGSFAGQATETAIKAVTIEYEGLVALLNIKPLTAVVLKGLLAPLMETVNMVSAPAVARERGLDIREVRHEGAGAYQTLIRLTITTEAQTRSIAGTLFNDEPRLVEIKSIPMDARLGPHMIYITNRDKPGFIGSLGMLLGNAGINIATFNLGRDKPGGDAIALIEVDQGVDEALTAKIRELPQVKRCMPMRF